MADNLTTPFPSGSVLATKDLGTRHIPLTALVDQAGADVLGLVAAEPGAETALGRLKAIADAVTTLSGHMDGLEGLATTLNGLVDGLEAFGGTSATEATLAALEAKLPTLGPKAVGGSVSVVPATASVFTTTSEALPAGTDRSSTVTAGGTAQTLAPANANRKALYGQNISAGDLWINEIGGAAAVDTAGSYRIPSGQNFSVSTNRAISIIGATTGQRFTATEI